MSYRAKRYFLEAALTVGAIAGLLCVITAIVGVAFGLSPLIFRSGSMAPTIDVGDVAISRSVPAADVAVGDIVSVSRPDGTRITHRVASVDSRVGNSTTMILRGDANSINDPEPYTTTTVDRVLFHIPHLGYVLSWFANPYSWAMATLLTLALLWAAFRPDKSLRQVSPGRHTSSSTRSTNTTIAVQGLIVVVVVAAAVSGFTRTHGTLAALTDSATDTGSVSAVRPDAPTSLSCANETGGLLETNARLSWPNPASHQNYEYQLIFTRVLSGASKSVVVPATNANPATLLTTRTYFDNVLGLALLGFYNVELRSKVGNFLSTGKLTISLNLLLGSVTCGSATGTPAAARSAPAQTTTTPSQTPSTSTTSQMPATSSTPVPGKADEQTTSSNAPSSTTSSEQPTASPPPPSTATPASLPDTTSPGGTYVATGSVGTVVIRDNASDTEEYRTNILAVNLDWVDDVTLRVTANDGTVTTLTRADGQWTTSGDTTTVATAG